MINHGLLSISRNGWELLLASKYMKPFKPRLELLARMRAKKQGGY